jgi:predicted TIM-barrel fold metal-dependent hydrolase
MGFTRPNGTFYLLPEDALDLFERTDVARGVILPEVHYEASMTGEAQRVEEVAEIVAKYPDRFYFFMNLSPHSFYINPEADYSPLIEYYLAMGAKGVGEMCENLTWYDPLMDNMLMYVNKYKLPFIFHMTHKEFCDYGIRDDEALNGLERALQKWKNITFLGHSADFWAEISGDDFHTGYPKGPVLPGGRVVELMRKYPNLCGDLSDGTAYNAIARDESYGPRFLSEFEDRLYFGTDMCFPTMNVELDKLLLHWRETGKISETTFRKIAYENAEKLLGL